jgi:hypothetical protein
MSGGFKAIYGSGANRYEHPGVDYAGPLGTPIHWRGNLPGKVTMHRPGDGWGDGSFGVCAIVDVVGTPFWVVYAHMPEADFRSGARDIAPGGLLGHIGVTGVTSGPHVHWGLSQEDSPAFAPARYNDFGGVGRIGNKNLLDPLAFLVEEPAATPDKANAEILKRLAAVEATVARIDNQGVVLGYRPGSSRHSRDGEGYDLLGSVRELHLEVKKLQEARQ